MRRPCPRPKRLRPTGARRRAGFTLAEALVCITLITLAGSALLLATELTLDASVEALEEKVAEGVANQREAKRLMKRLQPYGLGVELICKVALSSE